MAIKLLTLDGTDSKHFEGEITPFVPMLIEVNKGYYLSPVSSILISNPFFGIRRLQSHKSEKTRNSIRKYREDWMISDLYHLFLGNRYETVDGTARLKRKGNPVTDIDAAVLDKTNGELSLFQLKWQDFGTNDIKKQRSSAKNFVTRVDKWGDKVLEWIGEYGEELLCRSLRLHIPTGCKLRSIKLFAIGRSHARFQSYGYSSENNSIASCSWKQFVRIRHEIGPVEGALTKIHDQIMLENTAVIDVKPIPHTIKVDGFEVVFEDLWCSFDENKL